MDRAVDALVLRRWCLLARDRLTVVADELNRLNVFPVADADTGTNVRATLDRVCAELPDEGAAHDVAAAMAHGALVGALGNSGTILSQLLAGFSTATEGVGRVGSAELTEALAVGAQLARRAVAAPVEGTVLSVAEAAAHAAGAARSAGATLPVLAGAAASAAADAVAATTAQLPALAEAGVVDAAGRAWSLMLDALVDVLDDAPDRSLRPLPGAMVATPLATASDHAPRFEVQYLLDELDRPGAEAADALRRELAAAGESVVVVGGDRGLLSVHVHLDDVDIALAIGRRHGRPHRVEIVELRPAPPSPAADEGVR